MKTSYVFTWLDQLINDLNSAFLNNDPFSEEKTSEFIQKVKNEKYRFYQKLKEQVFNAKDEKRTKLLIRKNYNSLVMLIDKIYHMRQAQQASDYSIKEVLEYLSVSLEEMQQFIELSYPLFLSPEVRVPVPELLEMREELQQSILSLPEILKRGKNNKKIIGIVIEALNKFIDRIDRKEIITVKEASYHHSFVRDLKRKPEEIRILPDCPTLHELLFLWNFNSKEALTYFATGLEELISAQPGPNEKLAYMRLQFKQLLNLPVMPKMIYDKQYPGIKSYFSNYLKNEIEYLEQKIAGVTPIVESLPVTREKLSPYKVLVDLTSDQIGLILRAADEARLIVAKSMSMVFQSIVPYISTPRKENPSWQTMRSKTYNPERREIELAVDALEKMIKIIRRY